MLLVFLDNANAQSVDTVKIGTYIISLHDINFRDKEYTIRFWVWMKYKNPKLDFANKVEVPNAKETEVQSLLVDTSGGKVWALMKLKCVMKQSWKVNDYPFDKQMLKLRIENTDFDLQSMIFKTDTSGKHFDPELIVDGWNITNFLLKTNTSHYYTSFGDDNIKGNRSAYSAFNIEIDMERNAWGLFLKLFIGMYIAFLIAFISFFIDHKEVEPRFALPVGGLFAAVGNKYIIDTLLPESTNFTLVDTLHAFTFIFIFLILSASVYTLRLYDHNQKERARKIDVLGRYVIGITFLLINVYFVSLAIFD